MEIHLKLFGRTQSRFEKDGRASISISSSLQDGAFLGKLREFSGHFSIL